MMVYFLSAMMIALVILTIYGWRYCDNIVKVMSVCIEIGLLFFLISLLVDNRRTEHFLRLVYIVFVETGLLLAIWDSCKHKKQ